MFENAPIWENLVKSAREKQHTKAERASLLLVNLDGQVKNGGFSQWVYNGYASGEGAELLDVLKKMANSPNAAAVRDDVKKILEYVKQVPNRGFFGNYLKKDGDFYFEEFQGVADEADSRYYEINDGFMVEVETYLKGLM